LFVATDYVLARQEDFGGCCCEESFGRSAITYCQLFFFFFLMNELVRLAVKDVLSIAFANEFAVKALAVVCWVVFLSFFF
jgi:hypothetical protein